MPYTHFRASTLFSFFTPLFLTSILILPLQAQSLTKLLPSDGNAFDLFGWAVSTSGNQALVGAPYGGSESGSAYIFEFENGVWNQITELEPDDGAARGFFGGAVSLSGNLALIGSRWHNGVAKESGAAYLYEFQHSKWTQVKKFLPTDGEKFDAFGGAVAISGDRIMIGAPLNDNKGQGSGAVYVFERQHDTWRQTDKLRLPMINGGVRGAEFGHAVALWGSRALIGAPWGDGRKGAAYVYDLTDGKWEQTAKLSASDGELQDFFGRSLSLNGNRALIGGSNTESAYIFELNDTGWTEVAKLNASDGEDIERFGYSVSLSDQRAIIGADIFRTGSVYVFQRQGDDWNEVMKILASDGMESDSFGNSISLSGDHIFIGAPRTNDKGLDSGSAYVYQFTENETASIIKRKLNMQNDVLNPQTVPAETSLYPNHPNPFNPSTVIRFALPEQAPVWLTVYDMLGKEVKTLVNGIQEAGSHEVTFDATGLPSGTYLYRLETPAGSFVHTMVFFK